MTESRSSLTSTFLMVHSSFERDADVVLCGSRHPAHRLACIVRRQNGFFNRMEYGCCGVVEHRARVAAFHRLAALHDQHAVADVIGRRKIVRDIDDRDPSSSRSALNRLTIVIRSDASTIETGSSATISEGCEINARAMAIRCSCPPDSSCGIAARLRPATARP